MKKLSLSLFVLFSFLTMSVHAQDYAMTAPVGYGAGATGGGNATPIVVTDYAGLKTQLISSTAAVIIVNGTITIPSKGMISVKSNKTLLGLPGAKLVSADQTKDGSGILSLGSGISNVIIRNLIFEGPGAYDTDGKDLLSNTGCSKLWVDHCEFYDGVDGNFDNTNSADNVTISWCKFGYNKTPKPDGPGGSDDHRFSNLVGGDVDDFPTDGAYSITFMFCHWQPNCKERMPRARNAQLHLLNCLNTSGGLAIGLQGGDKGSKCYVEGTVFDKCTTYKDYGGTYTLTFVDCINKASDKGAAPKPVYTYTALPSAQVKAAVTSACGAGATLNVTSAGVVSVNTACAGTLSPTIALTSATATATQSVQSGTSIQAIEYTYGGSADGFDILYNGTTTKPSWLNVSTVGSKTTFTGTPTATSTTTVTISINSKKGTSTKSEVLTATITTIPLSAGTLTLNSSNAIQSIYTGQSIGDIKYTWGGGATGVTITGLPTDITPVIDAVAKTAMIKGAFNTAGIYNYTITTTGGLSPISLNGTITVTAPVQLAQPAATYTKNGAQATISWGTVANASSYKVKVCSGSGSGTSKTWNFNNCSAATYTTNTTITTDLSIVSTGKAVSFVATTGSYAGEGITKYCKLAGSGTITNCALKVTTTSAGTLTIYSNAADNDRTVIVNDGTNIISNQDESTNTTVCTIPSAGNYYIYSASSSINLFLIKYESASSCTETAVASGTTYTASNLAGTNYTFFVQSIGNGSAYLTSEYSQAIEATTPIAASISRTSEVGTDNQTKLVKETIADITYTYTGVATITWTGTTNNTVPAGITVTNQNGTLKISGTPTVAGNFSYNINVAAIAGGTPASTSARGIINISNAPVNATIILSSTTASPSVTTGSAINVAYSYTGSFSSILWSGSSSSTPAGITENTSVPGTFTISGTPTVVGTYNYTVTIRGLNGGEEVSTSGTITVTAPLTAPTNVNATPSNTSINISWTAVTGATGYKVNVCSTNSGSLATLSDFTASTGATAITQNTDGSITKAAGVGLVLQTPTLGNLRGAIVTVDLDVTSTAGKKMYVKVNNNESSNSTNSIGSITDNIVGIGRKTVSFTINNYSTGNDYVALRFEGNFTATIYSATITAVGGGSSTPSCKEYQTSSNSITIPDLSPNTEYTYQVKAIKGTEESSYCTAKSVTTSTLTSIDNISGDKIQILQTSNELIVTGAEVSDICLYTASGMQIDCIKAQVIDISALKAGVYVAKVLTVDGQIATKKFFIK